MGELVNNRHEEKDYGSNNGPKKTQEKTISLATFIHQITLSSITCLQRTRVGLRTFTWSTKHILNTSIKIYMFLGPSFLLTPT